MSEIGLVEGRDDIENYTDYTIVSGDSEATENCTQTP